MKDGLPRLIVASSEADADMLYATRFFVPDAFVFLEKDGHREIMLSQLEVDRGRREAAMEVVAYKEISDRLKRGSKDPEFHIVLAEYLRERRVKKARVPASFPLGLAMQLAKAGIALVPESGLFWKQREQKTAEELRSVRRALAITEAGMARAMEVLRAAEIAKGNALRWSGRRLTSEILRAEIDSAVLRAGGVPANTIVAGGEQACDPHELGHGPLRAGSLIIVDIFPRDPRTGYYGDLTRTVVRGRATDAQRKLWETVKAGQTLAIRAMAPGVSGKKVHESVKDFFTKQGYPTEQVDGRWGGFFHGTGHGLGLDLHEEPRFQKTTFKPGQVMTVEPGLYYSGLGGARLEDVVTVTDTGTRMLSRFPKELELI